MANLTIVPYLFFRGSAKEAIEFYKSVFGGELETNSYDDLPEGSPITEGVEKGWLMHSSLDGGDVKLMASDTPHASPIAKKVSLSLGGTDEEYMRKIFDQLSAGGKVFMSLKKESWGDIFG